MIFGYTQVIFSKTIYLIIFLSCLYPLIFFFTFRISQNITVTRGVLLGDRSRAPSRYNRYVLWLVYIPDEVC